MTAEPRAAERPLVSVIVAAFDAEKYLAEALDSILAQDYPAIEVIVVDDGSSDMTAKVIASYGEPVRCLCQPHRGLSAAHNHGIAAASGEYLSFLDADDLWLPEKTSRQLAVLDTHPEVDAVFGHVEQFYDRPGVDAPELALPDRLRVMPGFLAAAMLIRRKAFDRVGPYDETLKLGQFIDWYARAVHSGITSHLLPEVVMRRRIHDTNMGIRHRADRGDYLRVLKSALDRRRGLGQGS